MDVLSYSVVYQDLYLIYQDLTRVLSDSPGSTLETHLGCLVQCEIDLHSHPVRCRLPQAEQRMIVAKLVGVSLN